MNVDKVTRFEVIGSAGRLLTKQNVAVKLSLQDDDRTLKVFLSNREVCKTCDGNGVYLEYLGERWMGAQEIGCEDCQ